MKKLSFYSVCSLLLAAVTLVAVTACDQGGAAGGGGTGIGDVTLANERDSASYCLGLSISQQLQLKEGDLNAAAVAKAINDAVADNPAIENADVQRILNGYLQALNQKKTEAARQEGIDYLEANKGREGVQETASGLQYEVLTEGTGKQPTTADKVEVHYRGTLIDGTEFDSSYKRGQTVTFPVTGVIPGWTEALQLMKEGAKYKLHIPQALAYGARGNPPTIPPYSTLVFEVELVSVNPDSK